ncbi:MAG: CoA-binding protein [Nitratiruptor sp.]|nr:CoA-binding protein [Nitratiruptor sp.]NPA84117.1 CoA-binding protein [Campylobacterota bacterium]
MECPLPQINANEEEIRQIFETVKTIAVVGLSPDPSKDSHKVAAYLQSVGYRIVPIYPRGGEILGERVYRSLEEIPFPIDMVDIFRKPAAIPPIVEAAIKRGDVRVIWMQKGIVNDEAAKRAREAGLIVVQNRCTMVDHRRLVAGR